MVNHLTYDALGNIISELSPSLDHIDAYTGRES